MVRPHICCFKKEMNPFRRKPTGFTLIELLVVIGIIALLAAILFPVFGRARENSRKTSCLNNLKQLGIAFQMYSQDYDLFMPVSEGATTPNKVYALERLGPYAKSDQYLKCPSDSSANTRPIRNIANTGTVPCSYYVVGSGIGNPVSEAPTGSSARWGIFDQSGAPVNITSIVRPAETIYASERGPASIDYHLDRGTATPTGGDSVDANDGISNRHLQGANYLFGDGHTKWYPRPPGSTISAPNDQTGVNESVTQGGTPVRYYYFWRIGVPGKATAG